MTATSAMMTAPLAERMDGDHQASENWVRAARQVHDAQVGPGLFEEMQSKALAMLRVETLPRTQLVKADHNVLVASFDLYHRLV